MSELSRKPSPSDDTHDERGAVQDDVGDKRINPGDNARRISALEALVATLTTALERERQLGDEARAGARAEREERRRLAEQVAELHAELQAELAIMRGLAMSPWPTALRDLVARVRALLRRA